MTGISAGRCGWVTSLAKPPTDSSCRCSVLFLREESCKLLSKKPLLSEGSGSRRPWQRHSSACQFPFHPLVSMWHPHPQLCPSPLNPQSRLLNFFSLPWGWGRPGCLSEGSRHGIWGLLSSYTNFQPTLLCRVSPAPLFGGTPGAPNSWTFLGVIGAN